MAAFDKVILLTAKLLLALDGSGLVCLFVEANVLCCICDAPPSIARKMKEPVGKMLCFNFTNNFI